LILPVEEPGDEVRNGDDPRGTLEGRLKAAAIGFVDTGSIHV